MVFTDKNILFLIILFFIFLIIRKYKKKSDVVEGIYRKRRRRRSRSSRSRSRSSRSRRSRRSRRSSRSSRGKRPWWKRFKRKRRKRRKSNRQKNREIPNYDIYRCPKNIPEQRFDLDLKNGIKPSRVCSWNFAPCTLGGVDGGMLDNALSGCGVVNPLSTVFKKYLIKTIGRVKASEVESRSKVCQSPESYVHLGARLFLESEESSGKYKIYFNKSIEQTREYIKNKHGEVLLWEKESATKFIDNNLYTKFAPKLLHNGENMIKYPLDGPGLEKRKKLIKDYNCGIVYRLLSRIKTNREKKKILSRGIRRKDENKICGGYYSNDRLDPRYGGYWTDCDNKCNSTYKYSNKIGERKAKNLTTKVRNELKDMDESELIERRKQTIIDSVEWWRCGGKTTKIGKLARAGGNACGRKYKKIQDDAVNQEMEEMEGLSREELIDFIIQKEGCPEEGDMVKCKPGNMMDEPCPINKEPVNCEGEWSTCSEYIPGVAGEEFGWGCEGGAEKCCIKFYSYTQDPEDGIEYGEVVKAKQCEINQGIVECGGTGDGQELGEGNCPVDCVGKWEPATCQADCRDMEYKITQEAQNGGEECEFTKGDTEICQRGDGECPEHWCTRHLDSDCPCDINLLVGEIEPEKICGGFETENECNVDITDNLRCKWIEDSDDGGSCLVDLNSNQIKAESCIEQRNIEDCLGLKSDSCKWDGNSCSSKLSTPTVFEDNRGSVLLPNSIWTEETEEEKGISTSELFFPLEMRVNRPLTTARNDIVGMGVSSTDRVRPVEVTRIGIRRLMGSSAGEPKYREYDSEKVNSQKGGGLGNGLLEELLLPIQEDVGNNSLEQMIDNYNKIDTSLNNMDSDDLGKICILVQSNLCLNRPSKTDEETRERLSHYLSGVIKIDKAVTLHDLIVSILNTKYPSWKLTDDIIIEGEDIMEDYRELQDAFLDGAGYMRIGSEFGPDSDSVPIDKGEDNTYDNEWVNSKSDSENLQNIIPRRNDLAPSNAAYMKKNSLLFNGMGGNCAKWTWDNDSNNLQNNKRNRIMQLLGWISNNSRTKDGDYFTMKKGNTWYIDYNLISGIRGDLEKSNYGAHRTNNLLYSGQCGVNANLSEDSGNSVLEDLKQEINRNICLGQIASTEDPAGIHERRHFSKYLMAILGNNQDDGLCWTNGCVNVDNDFVDEFEEWEAAKEAARIEEQKAILLAALVDAGEDAAGILRDAEEALQSDKDVVLAAIAANGLALEHASVALQEDREVVRMAVSQNIGALDYASDELQGDDEFVQAVAEAAAAAAQAAEQAEKQQELDNETTKFEVVNELNNGSNYTNDSTNGGWIFKTMLEATKETGADRHRYRYPDNKCHHYGVCTQDDRVIGEGDGNGRDDESEKYLNIHGNPILPNRSVCWPSTAGNPGWSLDQCEQPLLGCNGNSCCQDNGDIKCKFFRRYDGQGNYMHTHLNKQACELNPNNTFHSGGSFDELKVEPVFGNISNRAKKYKHHNLHRETYITQCAGEAGPGFQKYGPISEGTFFNNTGRTDTPLENSGGGKRLPSGWATARSGNGPNVEQFWYRINDPTDGQLSSSAPDNKKHYRSINVPLLNKCNIRGFSNEENCNDETIKNYMRYAGCDGDYEPCKRNGNAQLPAGKSCQDCENNWDGRSFYSSDGLPGEESTGKELVSSYP